MERHRSRLPRRHSPRLHPGSRRSPAAARAAAGRSRRRTAALDDLPGTGRPRRSPFGHALGAGTGGHRDPRHVRSRRGPGSPRTEGEPGTVVASRRVRPVARAARRTAFRCRLVDDGRQRSAWPCLSWSSRSCLSCALPRRSPRARTRSSMSPPRNGGSRTARSPPCRSGGSTARRGRASTPRRSMPSPARSRSSPAPRSSSPRPSTCSSSSGWCGRSGASCSP